MVDAAKVGLCAHLPVECLSAPRRSHDIIDIAKKGVIAAGTCCGCHVMSQGFRMWFDG